MAAVKLHLGTPWGRWPCWSVGLASVAEMCQARPRTAETTRTNDGCSFGRTYQRPAAE